jgi:hypothetical protein
MTLELNTKRSAIRAQSVSGSEVETDDAASTNN